MNLTKIALLTILLPTALLAAPTQDKPKVLFFTKSSGFQHPIIKIVDGKPSLAMAYMDKIAQNLGIDIIESKDGTLITEQNLQNYAAVIFYTSGDLSTINAKSDKAPAVSPEGKAALLKHINSGKLHYVGIHAASDCYHTSGEKYQNAGDKTDPYLKMLGAEFIAHDAQEFALIRNTDPKFPGNTFPEKSQLKNEWYSFRNFADDLHVLLTLDGRGGKMVGPHYQRPAYPVAWTRMQGKGRVYYTALGHGRESWDDPNFINMLTGGITWALGRANPDVTPNIKQLTPGYAELTAPRAKEYKNPDGTTTRLPKPSNTPPKLD